MVFAYERFLLLSTGQGHKSWGSTVSDDSVGVDGGLESPTASTSRQHTEIQIHTINVFKLLLKFQLCFNHRRHQQDSSDVVHWNHVVQRGCG